MNKNKIITKENEPRSEVIPFIMPGGRDGDENWLAGLVPGTVFTTRGINEKDFNLMVCHVVHHSKVSTLLMIEDPTTGQIIRPRVDSLRFSRAKVLVEILGVVATPEKEKEIPEKEIEGNP